MTIIYKGTAAEVEAQQKCDHGGCTADNDFYKLLSKEWKATTNIDILRWPALYDYMCVYTRKKNGSSKKRN